MQAPCLHQGQARQRTPGAPLGGKPTSSCPSLSSEGWVNPTEYCWAVYAAHPKPEHGASRGIVQDQLVW